MSETPEAKRIEKEKRTDNLRQLAETLYSETCDYRRHKEIMAHACIVLELGLVAWRTSDAGFKVFQSGIWGKLAPLLAWFLIHFYMRWQLHLRRWGAIQSRGLEKTLGRCAIGNIPEKDLNTCNEKLERPHILSRFVDHMFPLRRGRVPYIFRRQECPAGLVKDLQSADRESQRYAWSDIGERIVTFASFTMLSFLLALWSCSWSILALILALLLCFAYPLFKQ